MQPALNPKNGSEDYVFLSKWSVRNMYVERGDIISLTSPKDPKQKLIKRIVGLQGKRDRVHLHIIPTNRPKTFGYFEFLIHVFLIFHLTKNKQVILYQRWAIRSHMLKYRPDIVGLKVIIRVIH